MTKCWGKRRKEVFWIVPDRTGQIQSILSAALETWIERYCIGNNKQERRITECRWTDHWTCHSCSTHRNNIISAHSTCQQKRTSGSGNRGPTEETIIILLVSSHNDNDTNASDSATSISYTLKLTGWHKLIDRHSFHPQPSAQSGNRERDSMSWGCWEDATTTAIGK